MVKINSFIFVLLLSISEIMAASNWWSYSNPIPIRDVIPFEDGVLLATGGGVRYRSKNADILYHSANGLETSNIYSVVSTAFGVFAISEYGRIAIFNAAQNSWKVLNRSYVKNQSRVVPGATIAAGAYLVIPFEDRLAIFDIDKSVSLITVDRVGSKNLAAEGVSRLASHGDSLYVRIGNEVYVRLMNWENLHADNHLADPDMWDQVDDWEDMEELALRDSSWTISTKEGTYELTQYFLMYEENGKTYNWSLREDFPLQSLYEITTLPGGGFMAASVEGRLAVTDGLSWWINSFDIGVGSVEATSDQRIKTISALPDNQFFHIWGNGFFVFNKGVLEHSLTPYGGYCFDNYEKNWTVAPSSTPAPDGSGFLTATASNDGYSLVYITKRGEAYCTKIGNDFAVGGPMFATMDEDGSWVVYIGAKESLGSDNGRFDIVRFPSPKSHGNEIVNAKVRSIGGVSPPLYDIAYDSVSQRIWTVSSTTLFYYDKDQDTLYAPMSVDGLRGADFTSIETDVHGNLWAGTTNQGVYRFSIKGKSPDTLTSARYTTIDGLLSNNVKDVAIDPVNGIACFAHENGATCHRRNDLKSAKQNMTDSAAHDVAAYPIPFRPKVHATFIIENIAENATVGIYNRGGSLVRSFYGSEILGGRLEWDGKGKDQRLVAPGVYYYVVNTPSKTKKGKFIIIH